MKRIDRYVLNQLIGPFLFFLIIFGGILWLNQALKIVDVVVSNGQSGKVFAELSLYLLPKVLETVVPVAAFGAAVFLTNRLYSEAELVVFYSVGHGPANSTVPFWAFGVVCFVLMSLLTHVLTPTSLWQFQERQHEIGKEFLTQFVIPGEFASPVEGVTIFFGETTPEGNLRDVLINDRRDGALTVTHTASSGQLISSETTPKLILFNGTIQQFSTETRTLSTINFESLSYDLSQFAKKVSDRNVSAREMWTWQLPNSGVTNASTELHDRFVKSMLSVVVPVLGAIVLLSAGFSRGGFFLRIVLGVVFMVAINSMRGMVQSISEDTSLGWPILYLPVLAAFLAVLFMVRSGQLPWKSGIKGFISPNRDAP